MTVSTEKRVGLELPKARKSTYTIVIFCHCHECDCHDLTITVKAKSALKAMHKAATKLLPKLPTEYRALDPAKIHDYEITIDCNYANDRIRSECSAESAAEALYQDAMFDSRAREMHSLEW